MRYEIRRGAAVLANSRNWTNAFWTAIYWQQQGSGVTIIDTRTGRVFDAYAHEARA